MRRNVFGFMAAGLGLLFASAPVLAHHSFAAEYDSKKPIKISGTVTKVEFMNPHIYYYVDVKDSSGKVTNYAVEGGTPGSLRRQGWGKDSLKARRSASRFFRPSTLTSSSPFWRRSAVSWDRWLCSLCTS